VTARLRGMITASFSFCLIAAAQNSPAMVWSAAVGSGLARLGVLYPSDVITAATSDGAGNIYLTGLTTRQGPAQPFVTKLSPDGQQGVYVSILASPNVADPPVSVSVDANGEALVALKSGVLTKIGPEGDGVVFSVSFAGGILGAVDALGDSYVLSPNSISRVWRNGAVLWTRTFVNNPAFARTVLAFDPDGSAVTAGTACPPAAIAAPGVAGGFQTAPAGGCDILIELRSTKTKY